MLIIFTLTKELTGIFIFITDRSIVDLLIDIERFAFFVDEGLAGVL